MNTKIAILSDGVMHIKRDSQLKRAVFDVLSLLFMLLFIQFQTCNEDEPWVFGPRFSIGLASRWNLRRQTNMLQKFLEKFMKS